MYSCSKSSQEPVLDKVQVESNVGALLEAQLVQWNLGNIDGFMEGYWDSPEMRFVSSKSVIMGHPKLTEMYKKSFPKRDDMGKLKFAVNDKKWMGEEVLSVLGQWEVLTEDTTRSGNFCLFFMEVDEGWRIVEDHTW